MKKKKILLYPDYDELNALEQEKRDMELISQFEIYDLHPEDQ